jgi:hypothetical protein
MSLLAELITFWVTVAIKMSLLRSWRLHSDTLRGSKISECCYQVPQPPSTARVHLAVSETAQLRRSEIFIARAAKKEHQLRRSDI